MCAVSFLAWSQQASFCACGYELVAIRRRRKGNPYAESSVGHGVGGDGGVVGGGDGLDDGQAEPVAVLVVGAARVEALEGLEETVDFGWAG